MKRIGLYAIMTSCILCMLCAGCGSVMEYEGTGDGTNGAANEVYSSYLELSRTETVSALDVALGKVPEADAEGKICGLTEADVEYIASLSSDSLLSLKTEIMERWGIESDEEIENTLDHAYEAFTADMDADELSNFNMFVHEYMDGTGFEVCERYIRDLSPELNTDGIVNTYVHAAVAMDKFGRNLYGSFGNTRSLSCRKAFGARLAIASISMAWGMLIPGADCLVMATCVCEALSAGLDYYRCIRG